MVTTSGLPILNSGSTPHTYSLPITFRDAYHLCQVWLFLQPLLARPVNSSLSSKSRLISFAVLMSQPHQSNNSNCLYWRDWGSTGLNMIISPGDSNMCHDICWWVLVLLSCSFYFSQGLMHPRMASNYLCSVLTSNSSFSWIHLQRARITDVCW